MDQIRRHSLQYFLLSAANPPMEYVNLHDRAFSSWMSITQAAFKEVSNENTSHLHDDFIRQNLIACLTSNGKVIATFLHSFASIYSQAAREFRYMKDNYPDSFFHKIQKLGIQNVLTSHYLAIDPEWRRGKMGVDLASLMIGFTPRIRDHYGADAFIGVYRRDRKVHEIAYSLGGECIVENVSNHNTPCDLILMNGGKPYVYPTEELKDQITRLWEDRIDTTIENAVRKAA